MSRQEFKTHIQKLLSLRNRSIFHEEFERLNYYVMNQPGYGNRMMKSTEIVRKKNRYSDVVVFDDTRVKLATKNTDDYINASIIKVDVFPNTEFICCQAPLKSCLEDFWRMCWENRVPAIVMLTKWEEQSGMSIRKKADVYLPLQTGESLSCGSFQIRCKDITTYDDIPGLTKRELELSYDGRSIAIPHFHYTDWPDFGAVAEIDSYLKVHATIARTVSANTTGGPMLVHCSAGIGRSGAFIAIEYLLQNIQQQNDTNFDVPQLVIALRNRRPGMVLTESQYEMVYEVICYVLFGKSFLEIDSRSTAEVTQSDDTIYHKLLKREL